MAENFTSTEQFEVEECIGRGAFGHVFRIRSKFGDAKTYAMKRIPFEELDQDMKVLAMQESNFLAKLQHKHVVGMFGCFWVGTVNHIVMEMFPLGSLKKMIKARKTQQHYFHESDVLRWAGQLALALEHIHSLEIVHRDIKTEHLFLGESGVLKLGGFGFAKGINDPEFQHDGLIGTPTHMAPELWKEVVGDNHHYSFETDAWAYGVTLYELCALKLPFPYATDVSIMFNAICMQTVSPLPPFVNMEIRTLVENRLLAKIPYQRPSMTSVLQISAINAAITLMS